ncbi:MAG: beta-galactosidase trimerization domain-containing protein [Chloroflexota bacterium]|nr:beta-galactosidase trimerization domain-containing protein [Chloroflexota bacterium]
MNWWHRPLRAVHTVLREPDAADFDLPAVLDWLRHRRANVYAVNGGGLCAFYRSDVPFHRPNRYLNGRDLFPEIVAACHEAGIKVVARMDFRGGHREVFEAHPDWFARDAAGEPKMTTTLYAACPNSPYRNDDYAFPLVHEVLGRCGADGIWENAASFGGRCYCPTCVRLFREDTGLPAIPLAENWSDPSWRRYVHWRYDRVRQHTQRLRDVVKSHGPDKSYAGEFFSFLEANARENAQDLDDVATLWDYQMACIFPLTRGSYGSPLLPVPLWRAEEQMKYLRATGLNTPSDRDAPSLSETPDATHREYPTASGTTDASHPDTPTTRGTPDSAQTPVMLYGHFDNASRYTTPAGEELRLWLAGMAAQGASPWDCSFVGVHPGRWWDRRHESTVEDFYAFLAEHEADFAALRSLADVAVLHSQRTQDRFAAADPAQDHYSTHFRGWELALFAMHLQWDVLPPSHLHPHTLRRYRAIVLPNVACLDDADVAILRDYVAAGGALLATFETGLYHADGSPRAGGALDDLLGVRDLGLPRRGPLPHAYTRIRTRDALTAGFDATDVLTNEGAVRPIAARDGARVHATLVPEIFPQPPDLSYPTLWDNDAPLLVTTPGPGTLGTRGTGRTVYFANTTDRLNVTSRHPDHQRLLENALHWALDLERRPPLLETTAPPDVHLTLFHQSHSGRLTLHLVNYSGAHGRPATAPHPTGPIGVTLHLPAHIPPPRRAELLVSGTSLDVTLADTTSAGTAVAGGNASAAATSASAATATSAAVHFTLPTLDRYELVRLAPDTEA